MPQWSFPRKIARGDAFCNRLQEKTRLKENYETNQHTLIVSPRRYGKSSLAMQTIAELDVAYAYAQFLNAFSDEVIVKRLTLCLSELLTKIESPTKKALLTLGKFFTRVRLSLEAYDVGVGFKLEPVTRDSEILILSLFEGIEKLLKTKKQKAIIFLDEFQDIAQADMTDQFQSILRDFAQRTEHVIFIISGSNRRLLESMFDDRNKPFYKLFDKMKLARIGREHYFNFLQGKAQSRWGLQLPNDYLNEIFNLTECHAYYFNRICDELWRLDQMPEYKDIHTCWQYVIESEFDNLADDLSRLTKNQRVVLQAIAQHDVVKEPSSRDFVLDAGLSHGSIIIAIKKLHQLDYIEHMPEGYRVIDPGLKSILMN